MFNCGAAVLRCLPAAIALALCSAAALEVWDAACAEVSALAHDGVVPTVATSVHKGPPLPPPPPAVAGSPGLQIVKVVRRLPQKRGQALGAGGRVGDDLWRSHLKLDHSAQLSAILANAASLSRLCRLLL